MNKPHRHKDLIIAWANGAEIEVLDRHKSPTKWIDAERPAWLEDLQYRIKPEREYPKSSLLDEELCNIVGKYLISVTQADVVMAREIADAAVKRYIKDNEE